MQTTPEQRHSMQSVLEGALRFQRAVGNWLHHATPAKRASPSARHRSTRDEIDELARENVRLQSANLTTRPSVAAGMAENGLRVHGWLDDIATGQVHALDAGTGRFLPLIDLLTIKPQHRRTS